MATTRKKYTQKFKDEAVELFLASDLPITHVASNVGVKAGTLGNWIKKYREDNPEKFDTGQQETVSVAEHQRVVAENAKLKHEIEFLGKVSAFFAAKQQ
ncbi:transposase [Brevibacterium sandarakinum]|uniref:Transposase n=1 Tax=Brevibacterium sandarakinum TaxID=629680 RepID=A0A1H1N3Q1_BRESA|nr:transposase [Brevibacterium sandarakinum]SDR93520.1 transposase [Brevibacterium sandarakinum]